MKKIVKSYFKKSDLSIYFFIILITGFFLIFPTQLTKNHNSVGKSKIVEISFNGKKFQYSLYLNKEIILKNGNIIIEITDNRVRVKKSDCPDKLCVKKGWIKNPGEFIICMPNKLVIQIIGDDNYDSITY